jgi:hypothetical protein
MNVGELRELIDGVDDDVEVKGVEYGYRSSNMIGIGQGVVFEDDRTEDDYGKEIEPATVLFLELGSVGSKRYPPAGLRDELGG